jgi:hypothetical protein
MKLKTNKNTPLSQKLKKIAKKAFFNYVLPAILNELPGLKDKFIVNITSSVAYGMADKYSDIDLFIIFYNQNDYLKYVGKVETIINEIKFPEYYYSICDKGIRFELESLARADVEKILMEPTSLYNWLTLSSWLMYWLINSITIYDPLDIIRPFKKKWGRFPNGIATIKLRSLKIKALRNYFSLLRELKSHHRYFFIIYYVMKIINAIIDIKFLKKRIYPPHNKWKYIIFNNFSVATDRYLINEIFNMIKNIKLNDHFSNQLTKKINSLMHSIIPRNNFSNNKYFDQKVILQNFDSEKLYFHTNYCITKNDYYVSIKKLSHGHHILTAEETGIVHLTNKAINYDGLMRISREMLYYNQFLYLNKHNLFKISYNFIKKCKYYNFMIWRKIRVIEKGIKRNQPFMVYWYYVDVCLLLIVNGGQNPRKYGAVF